MHDDPSLPLAFHEPTSTHGPPTPADPRPTVTTPSYREDDLTVPSPRGRLIPPTGAPPGITITEAARRLGVSTKTVRRRIAEGSLAAHKASGPGGFQYRVTDPTVLVVRAGQAEPPVARDTAVRRERPSVDTAAVVTLAALLAESEAERRRLSLLLEQAREAPPVLVT